MSLRDDKGELTGLVSTTRDITARKKAEEQLAKYAEELRRQFFPALEEFRRGNGQDEI